jgi:hypothetical protein
VGQAERSRSVAEAFDASWAHMLRLPDWWPSASEVAFARLRREVVDADPPASSDYVDALGRSLRRWRAFRGARYDGARLADSLKAVAPYLDRWKGTSILTIRAKDVPDLFELFDAVREIKPTNRKWVATSKALHHLLPDLIPPMDNEITAPFFGRDSLPVGFDQANLVDAYRAFVDVARNPRFGIGPRKVRAAGREVPYPVVGSALQDCRVGLARVVDFAIAGFVLRHGRASLRSL